MAKAIITIGRQYGSGGREIGQRLAEKLGIKCYDSELLDRAAKDSGMCQEIFENHDERPTNSFLYSLVMDTYSMGYSSSAFADMPINHKVFLAQFNAIKEIAKEGPCVMVGRCADYILRDRTDCFNVFIHANMAFRIDRVLNIYQEKLDKPEKFLREKYKKRKVYYKYYTDRQWGVAQNYHLCLDTSAIGIDTCSQIILDLVKKS